jgi:hypothetical protein
VFFLVSDKLMEYDAVKGRAIVIRRASDTKLGRFSEMAESRDGGIWLTGARGLGYIPGPVRRLTPATVWQEFLVSETMAVENLLRPFEDERGGITALASSSAAPGKRVIVHFDGSRWISAGPQRGFEVRRGEVGTRQRGAHRLLPASLDQLQPTATRGRGQRWAR